MATLAGKTSISQEDIFWSPSAHECDIKKLANKNAIFDRLKLLYNSVHTSVDVRLIVLLSPFFSPDLRSALPALDRIVKGFRKLGAINKTKDVLYYQVPKLQLYS